MAEENVWKKLTRLFRSGPVVRHKIANGEAMPNPQGTAKAFKKELSSLYVRALSSYANYERLSRYSDYNEMEFCLSPSTLIAIPGGYATIKDLADQYGEDEFIVFSYDHSRKQIVPAVAKHARKTRSMEMTYRVKFDNGKEIIGTMDHRLMLRDGTYRKIIDLEVGDRMMPFRRAKGLLLDRREYSSSENLYAMYYDGSKWVQEHRRVAELLIGRELEADEVVHHINETKWDNRPANLEVMTRSAHSSHHLREFNKRKWGDEEWVNEFKRNHSQFMLENNPAERKDITFSVILQMAEKCEFQMDTVVERLDIDHPMVYRRLNANGFADWTQFATAYCPTWRNRSWDNSGAKNPRWNSSVDFQKICEAHSPGISPGGLVAKLKTSRSVVWKRVTQAGFKNISDFCKNYQNCTVVSVEPFEEMDVYDLTVEGYKNFATDSVISHNTPELHSAIDIYADEATVKNDENNVIEITSKNAEIKEILETLFFDVIDINFNAWSWMRHFVKFGDLCLFVDADPEHGVLNLVPIPINEIEREEGFDPNDPLATRFRWLTRGNTLLQNWQIIHFRLLGNDAYLPYGSSVLEPARRIWRQLILIEDAMLVYRIVRSPERRVFHIEIANTPAEQVDAFIEQVKTQMKRNTIVDPSSGRVDLRYNPLSVEEDYFLPKRGEQKSVIDTLTGGQFTGDIEDVQYIQSKMFAAIKIPRAYLGYEDQIGSKATLAQEDVRFSRTIERIQSLFVAELNKIAIIHLFLCGFTGKDLQNFEISMANPSTVAAQQRLELWRMKLEVAGMAQEGMFDRGFIHRKIFALNDKQIAAIKDGKRVDKLEDTLLQSIETPPEPEPAPDEPPAETPAEPAPGAEELPNTLGGPEATAPPPPPQNAGLERHGSLIGERFNRGSTGNRAEMAVDKGKNLFSTGEDQLALSFGTKKQTASDPNDLRASRRLITRPFSEEPEPDADSDRQIDECERLLALTGAWLRQRDRA